MSTLVESKRSAPSIVEALRGAPHEFEFLQAIRLLNLLTTETPDSDLTVSEESATPQIDAFKQRKPIGYDNLPALEIIRFRTLASYAFPPSEICDYDDRQYDDEETGPAEMSVAFMGMTGPQGVLPRHYTQAVIHQSRGGKGALWEFLDLFNHRQISLFYRAWEKYFFPVRYERDKAMDGHGKDDIFTSCLFSLIGFGVDGIQDRLSVNDEVFLYYSGQQARQEKSAISLERMINDQFEVASRVEQFVGEWLFLDPADQSCLPTSTFSGFNTALGSETIIGDKVWGVEHRFRIELGPMSYEGFLHYIPGAEAHTQLTQFVRNYVGPGLEFDIQPILAKEEIPQLQLEDGQPRQLGWNTWVLSEPANEDARDAVFNADGRPIMSL